MILLYPLEICADNGIENQLQYANYNFQHQKMYLLQKNVKKKLYLLIMSYFLCV